MAPEYEIRLVVKSDSEDEILRVTDAIKEISSPIRISAKPVLRRKTVEFNSSVKDLWNLDEKLSIAEIAKSLDSTESRVNKSVRMLISEGDIKPREKTKKKQQSDNAKELVLDYICDHDVVVINKLFEYLSSEGEVKISKQRIGDIVKELKEEGYKIKTYKEFKKELDEFNPIESNVKDSARREEIIQKISQLWPKYYSISAVQKELNNANTGIISVTEALKILVERKIIPNMEKPVPQNRLELDLTPLERSAPADFRIIRKSLLV